MTRPREMLAVEPVPSLLRFRLSAKALMSRLSFALFESFTVIWVLVFCFFLAACTVFFLCYVGIIYSDMFGLRVC